MSAQDNQFLLSLLTFSGNEHSRSSPALDNNIELKSFTDDTIDERTESKAMESKFKTEVEENSVLTNCQFFLQVEKVKNLLQMNCQFICNHCSYENK